MNFQDEKSPLSNQEADLFIPLYTWSARRMSCAGEYSADAVSAIPCVSHAFLVYWFQSLYICTDIWCTICIHIEKDLKPFSNHFPVYLRVLFPRYLQINTSKKVQNRTFLPWLIAQCQKLRFRRIMKVVSSTLKVPKFDPYRKIYLQGYCTYIS